MIIHSIATVLTFGTRITRKSRKMLSWLTGQSPKLLEDPEKIYKVNLIEKLEVSHDTRKFRFALPSPKHILGLPIGKHIRVIANVNEQEVSRKYTPLSSDDDKGYVDLVIKVYFKNVHPKFPDGGKMSQYMDSLKIGDELNIQGPHGRLEYFGKGQFEIKSIKKEEPPVKKSVKKISMVAGGTGIAPMLQLIRNILKNSKDPTQIALIFANQTEDDILLRPELDECVKNHPDKFKLWYTLDRPTDSWKFGKGFVSKEMISEHLFGPQEDQLFLSCGPPPMIKFVNSQLDELNYPKENRFNY